MSYTRFSRFLAAFALPLEMLLGPTGNIDNQLRLESIIYDRMFRVTRVAVGTSKSRAICPF